MYAALCSSRSPPPLSPTQTITQTLTGTLTSLHSTTPFLSLTYSYPLTVTQSFNSTSSRLTTSVDHSYNQQQRCSASLLSSWPEPAEEQTIRTSQQAKAEATVVDNAIKGGVGQGEQIYSYYDTSGLSFLEHTAFYNGTVTKAEKEGNLAPLADPVQ